MLFTAGRLRVCCSRSNMAVELSKQSKSVVQCSACQRSPAHCLSWDWLVTQRQCPGCLPVCLLPAALPCSRALIFASSSKGCTIMGVARPSLLHPRGSGMISLNCENNYEHNAICFITWLSFLQEMCSPRVLLSLENCPRTRKLYRREYCHSLVGRA